MQLKKENFIMSPFFACYFFYTQIFGLKITPW